MRNQSESVVGLTGFARSRLVLFHGRWRRRSADCLLSLLSKPQGISIPWQTQAVDTCTPWVPIFNLSCQNAEKCISGSAQLFRPLQIFLQQFGVSEIFCGSLMCWYYWSCLPVKQKVKIEPWWTCTLTVSLCSVWIISTLLWPAAQEKLKKSGKKAISNLGVGFFKYILTWFMACFPTWMGEIHFSFLYYLIKLLFWFSNKRRSTS